MRRSVVEIKAIAKHGISRFAFDAAAGDVQVQVAVAIDIEPQRRHILAEPVLIPGAGRGRGEPTRTGIEIQPAGLPGGAPDKQVLMAVRVGITPSKSRAELR